MATTRQYAVPGGYVNETTNTAEYATPFGYLNETTTTAQSNIPNNILIIRQAVKRAATY